MAKKLIEINLSSEFERIRLKRSNKVKIPIHFGLLISIIILAIGLLYLFLFFNNQSFLKIKKQYESVRLSSEELTHMIETNKYLAEQIIKVNQWHSNRINWASEWLKLSKMIPQQVYLKKIEARALDLKCDLILLSLSGRAYGDSAEREVIKFVNSLKRDKDFTEDYESIVMGSIISEGKEKEFSIDLTHTGQKYE